MSYVVLADPGTEFGPCADPCEHLDCAATREMAEAPCAVCGQPVGYGSAIQHELDGVGWAHLRCNVEEVQRRHADLTDDKCAGADADCATYCAN